MFDGPLRALKDRWLEPVARALGPRCPPTVVTVLGLAVGLAAAAAAARALWGAALVLWLVNRLLDGLDGTLARLHATQSDLGGYLDLVLDFLVYALVPAGIAWGAGAPRPWSALSALLGACYVNAASWMVLSAILERQARGAAARGERTVVTMPAGLIGGFETIVLYALMLAWPAGAADIMLVMAALVLATALQRVAWATGTLR